jgi:predicted ABC-type ATPase
MKTLYLIRGIPGSGKSSFAKQLEESGLVSWVFEADQFFMNIETGEYNFDASKLRFAHKKCQELTKLWLSDKYNHSVAVSNTSTTEKEVEVYRKIAEEQGAKFVSIVVESRHNGKNQHGVPEDKVQQMRNRFSIKL